MSRKRVVTLDDLEAKIGYRFSQRKLLEQALTHVSAIASEDRSASYQRLEFLGDRVLGLAVASALHGDPSGASEGALSRRLSELVRRETCAEVARVWSLGDHLRLGASEAGSGGRRRETTLADACEAVIGAVFIDGGWEAARSVVISAWGDRLAPGLAQRADPKTALQEWAQARGLAAPRYDVAERGGPDHAPWFLVTAAVAGHANGEGRGRSKRLAEQEAARAFLIREAIWADGEA